MRGRFHLTILFTVLSFVVMHGTHSYGDEATVDSILSSEERPSSLYAGFSQLLDDEHTFELDDLSDMVGPRIKRVALYYNGDRLHRKIPKQVHKMIENKLMGKIISHERFVVVECVDCRNTKVIFKEDSLKVTKAIESNQDLRKMSRQVRVDAFVFWNASLHLNKFTINLRMVDGKDNTILWHKEYSKKSTYENEDSDQTSVRYEFVSGTWGIGGDRDRTNALVDDASFGGVFTVGLRRREISTSNPNIQYTLGLEFFANASSRDEFNLSGINLEGRIVANLLSVQEYINAQLYFGVGQAFYNENHSLVFKAGMEFPFFETGMINFGMVMLTSGDVEWEVNSDYETTGTFGGVSYDLSLVIRF